MLKTGTQLSTRRVTTGLLLALTAFALGGCGGHAYITPGAGADLAVFVEDREVQDAYTREPMATFPAVLAVARVQASGYWSYRSESYGRGRYSVVTTRDVETDDHVMRLAAMPEVRSVAPLNRLIVSSNLESLKDLRLAAAELHADVLLIYTFDTKFRVKDHDIGPLGIVSLGLLPNHEARITTTASAALYDVRSGFLYGLAESTSTANKMANSWRTSDAIDDARIKAEREAFEGLLNEVEKTWSGTVAMHTR